MFSCPILVRRTRAEAHGGGWPGRCRAWPGEEGDGVRGWLEEEPCKEEGGGTRGRSEEAASGGVRGWPGRRAPSAQPGEEGGGVWGWPEEPARRR